MTTPLFSYNQRKHVEKYQFPLIIAFSIAKSIRRNQCHTMLRFPFTTAITVTVAAKEKGRKYAV